jgi:hypothetical protein
MSWRRVLPDELFEHQYSPNSGMARGYAVASRIYFDGHQNCLCDRAKKPEEVTWFLQHNDAEHGIYPVHFETMNDSLMKQLRKQLPSLKPGLVVHVTSTISYGRILSCTRHVHDGKVYWWASEIKEPHV